MLRINHYFNFSHLFLELLNLYVSCIVTGGLGNPNINTRELFDKNCCQVFYRWYYPEAPMTKNQLATPHRQPRENWKEQQEANGHNARSAQEWYDSGSSGTSRWNDPNNEQNELAILDWFIPILQDTKVSEAIELALNINKETIWTASQNSGCPLKLMSTSWMRNRSSLQTQREILLFNVYPRSSMQTLS